MYFSRQSNFGNIPTAALSTAVLFSVTLCLLVRSAPTTFHTVDVFSLVWLDIPMLWFGI
jgi:hypothetical protein